MNKVEYVINELIQNGMIPNVGGFEITEALLAKYIEFYGNLSKANSKFCPSLARKLAGINLLNKNIERGNKSAAGIVYIIGNNAWPNFVKVGMTVDLPARLAQYQTYDPHRSFFVKHYEFVLNRRMVESMLLRTFQVDTDQGEWISDATATEIVKVLINRRCYT